MLTDIFLIRHGHPLQHTGLNYHVLPGPGLSDVGRDEARQAAEFLAGRGIEQFFVSPFDRTTQTAEPIIEALDVPVTFTSLVQEHNPSEQFDLIRERVREFLRSAEDAPSARIGVISHGSPIRAFLLELSQDRIDLSRHVYPGGNPAPTAGIWHAQRSEQTWRIELVFKPT